MKFGPETVSVSSILIICEVVCLLFLCFSVINILTFLESDIN